MEYKQQIELKPLTCIARIDTLCIVGKIVGIAVGEGVGPADARTNTSINNSKVCSKKE